MIKFAPNYGNGKPQWNTASETATQNGCVAQDPHGNLCQFVNGTILPLNEVGGALQLYMPAPNLSVTTQPVGNPQRNTSLSLTHGPIDSGVTSPSKAAVLVEPSLVDQIRGLEIEYSKLECELKEVDKTEVIHGRTMNKFAKDGLIAKRRELVITMDKIRKAIKELKNRPPANAPVSPRAMMNRPLSPRMSPLHNRLPAFLQMQQANNMVPPSRSFYNGAVAAQYPGAYGHQSDVSTVPVEACTFET